MQQVLWCTLYMVSVSTFSLNWTLYREMCCMFFLSYLCMCLFLSTGEHPAAMQHGNSNSSATSLFFHSMFGAFFGRNRNTDTIHMSNNQIYINTMATDYSTHSIQQTECQLNKAVCTDATAAIEQKHRLHIGYSDIIAVLPITLAHQVYELLSGQLHIIIHTIYKQFPNTILCWLFHYIIGTVSIHLMLATNNSWF